MKAIEDLHRWDLQEGFMVDRTVAHASGEDAGAFYRDVLADKKANK